MDLKGRVLFITGGSRGIGLEIGKRAAKDGAKIVLAAKTAEPHPKLPGTIYTAADEIVAAGGEALPIILDVRDEMNVRDAVEQTVSHFGGIDICVNNASAISLTSTPDTDMKRYDLMHQINGRGTYLVSKYCIQHLKQSNNAHILNLAPPLDMKPKWFGPHLAYTMAKFTMSMCVLGMAEELKPDSIAVNGLWPRTAIATAAVKNVLIGLDEGIIKASSASYLQNQNFVKLRTANAPNVVTLRIVALITLPSTRSTLSSYRLTRLRGGLLLLVSSSSSLSNSRVL